MHEQNRDRVRMVDADLMDLSLALDNRALAYRQLLKLRLCTSGPWGQDCLHRREEERSRPPWRSHSRPDHESAGCPHGWSIAEPDGAAALGAPNMALWRRSAMRRGSDPGDNPPRSDPMVASRLG